MERQRLSEQLARLPVEELVAVLRDVFAARLPFPEEAAFCRSRFYLGTAKQRAEMPADQDIPGAGR